MPGIIRWDSTNNWGDPVAAGVYLYSVEIDGFKRYKKNTLFKVKNYTIYTNLYYFNLYFKL